MKNLSLFADKDIEWSAHCHLRMSLNIQIVFRSQQLNHPACVVLIIQSAIYLFEERYFLGQKDSLHVNKKYQQARPFYQTTNLNFLMPYLNKSSFVELSHLVNQ